MAPTVGVSTCVGVAVALVSFHFVGTRCYSGMERCWTVIHVHQKVKVVKRRGMVVHCPPHTHETGALQNCACLWEPHCFERSLRISAESRLSLSGPRAMIHLMIPFRSVAPTARDFMCARDLCLLRALSGGEEGACVVADDAHYLTATMRNIPGCCVELVGVRVTPWEYPSSLEVNRVPRCV